eukprot:1160558-Pelagomonas_calceolata.AAC.9
MPPAAAADATSLPAWHARAYYAMLFILFITFYTGQAVVDIYSISGCFLSWCPYFSHSPLLATTPDMLAPPPLVREAHGSF